ncbi:MULTISPECIES: hypothetical protein [Clostridia]|uniref:AMP-binding enzyme n=1 Tax=Clostridia TaxID=186801 RepID=UPI000EA2C7F6|nr:MULTISPECIES: hypothetical protein [Clostridia]NBJ70980.1 hypothetical protein [Roseburia sp. 1XD42-34]RKI75502.1 hypothetical protein D7V87_16080 [Clostridium sp. 1xD42-85]
MQQTEVRVINHKGEDVTPNGMEIGDIIVKGNGALQHAEHQQTLRDGWIFTGDKGTVDEHGRIHVQEARKDIPQATGAISTAYLEQILLQHPSIQEAAVIPVPHKEKGEIAHAFIVLKEKKAAISEEALISFCKQHSEDSTYPSRISIVDDLPKTSSGKILKVELRNRL